MRTAPFRFLLLAGLAASLFLTAACKRDRVSPEDDTISADDQSEANAENALSIDLLAAAPADRAVNNSPAVASADELRRIYGPCVTRTYNAATNVLTLDFGPVNCLCPDGRYRRGKILVRFTTETLSRRAGAEVTRHNYFVNDNQHTATRLFTDLGSGSFSVDVPSASIIHANNGGTHSWTANWQFTRTAGFGTPQVSDDEYQVTGGANGTNRRGMSYITTVQQPLIKRGSCYKYYVAGTVQIVNTRVGSMLLNYDPSGNQACDNNATVTMNGRTKTITLRR